MQALWIHGEWHRCRHCGFMEGGTDAGIVDSVSGFIHTFETDS